MRGGESGEFWLSLSVDEVVGVVGEVGLSLLESWSLSRCLGQMKEVLQSLSRMPEHLEWIQCLDFVLQRMEVCLLLMI